MYRKTWGQNGEERSNGVPPLCKEENAEILQQLHKLSLHIAKHCMHQRQASQ
jgi:hypothetical protein